MGFFGTPGCDATSPDRTTLIGQTAIARYQSRAAGGSRV